MAPPKRKMFLDFGLAKGILSAMRHHCDRACVILAVGFASFACVTVEADKLDDFVAAEIRGHHITGLSLAVIEGGKITRAQGYGFTSAGSNAPVTTATLFQAASISKAVAAVGALHLVEAGKLSLDADVNTELRSWKVPGNPFTTEQKVTLRRILNHSAGLTVHGFYGYAVDAPLPTLAQVLDGVAPANSSPVRVDMVPGSQWRYSGGGYTVMQGMLIDVSGKPFPEFMRRAVLKPLGMAHSTYEQPLSKEWVPACATGYYPDGKAVPGRWHVYPEMAAAGLWTTASDLARFAIGVQQSLAGKSKAVISEKMTRQMLTDTMAGDGLGMFVGRKGGQLWFSHNGRNEGFDASLMASTETGQGVAIMINANDNTGVMKDITQAVAKEYHWQE